MDKYIINLLALIQSLILGVTKFDPKTVPNLQMWLRSDGKMWQDFTKQIPATKDGDPIAVWEDSSGNGHDASQVIPNARFHLRLIDGQRVVESRAQSLKTDTFQVFPNKRGLILFCFGSRRETPQQTLLATHNSPGNAFIFYDNTKGADGNYKYFDGDHSGSNKPDDPRTWDCQQLHRTEDATLKFYRGQTLADTFKIKDIQQDSLPLHIGGTTKNKDFNGYITDIMIYGDITEDERHQIADYAIRRLPKFTIDSFPSVVGFGDSITAGYNASDDSLRWLNLVAEKKRWVIAYGSGENTTVLQNTPQRSLPTKGKAVDRNGTDTYSDRILRWKPDFIIIQYGLNDIRLNDPAFTASKYKQNLLQIINGLLVKGYMPDHLILGSPPYIPESTYHQEPPWNGGSIEKHKEYVKATQEAAKSTQIKYVDVYQWMVDRGGDILISEDGIHPNDLGHRVIAQAFLSVL